MGSAPPDGPEPHQVLLCVWGPHPDSLRGQVPSSRSNHPLVPGRITSPGGPEDTPGNKGGEEPLSLKSQTWAPRNVVGISNKDTGHWGNSAGSKVLLWQHRLGGLESKGWTLRTKGSHLIYHLDQAIEKGEYSLSHTWSYTMSFAILTSAVKWPFSIGYCDLWGRATLAGLTLNTLWHCSGLISLFHCLAMWHSFITSLPHFLPFCYIICAQKMKRKQYSPT
jgi:hypothetical protein